MTVLFVAVDDSRLPELIEDVRRIAPDSFWTVHRFGRAHPSLLPTGYIQVRSRPHLATGGRTRDASLRPEPAYPRSTGHPHLRRSTRSRSARGTASSARLPRQRRLHDVRS